MEIKPGNFVIINGQETVGEVLSVRGNDLEVAVGLMKLMVKKNKVTVTEPPEEDEEEDTDYGVGYSGVDTREKLSNFKFELDVRGKMKDEVITELSTWADDAILLGINEARIIHGRGTGVIKDTVRSILRKYKEVESLKDDVREKGGEGSTVVTFKAS